jgi:hypothetical protein
MLLYRKLTYIITENGYDEFIHQTNEYDYNVCGFVAINYFNTFPFFPGVCREQLDQYLTKCGESFMIVYNLFINIKI